MYTRAELSVGINDKGFLVPQRAVSRNPRGEPTAMFVRRDGTIESRVLTISTDLGSNWVATSGVADGDRIVVDGFQQAQVGKPVSPIEVALDENGVASPVKTTQPVAGVPADGRVAASEGSSAAAATAAAKD